MTCRLAAPLPLNVHPLQAVEVAPEHLSKINTLLADSRQKRALEQESLARSEAMLRKLVRLPG